MIQFLWWLYGIYAVLIVAVVIRYLYLFYPGKAKRPLYVGSALCIALGWPIVSAIVFILLLIKRCPVKKTPWFK